MKHLIKEEINEIKYLFLYQRGVVISEQTYSDVKPHITESTLDKKSFEVKMETAPEDNIDNAINSLVGKDKDEVKAYFLELKNTNPKWLKKLLKKLKRSLKNQANEFKKEIPKILTAMGVYTLAYMVFKDKVDNFVEDNTNLK
jgi:rubrerythrin